MSVPKIPDTDFVRLIQTIGPAATARRLKINERGVHSRRKNLERRLGTKINTPRGESKSSTITHPQRVSLKIDNGVVIVGGDPHYWPGHPSTAHRAFVKFIKKYKPKAVIMNGDVFDGATVSRHPSINWENNPSVVDELEVCQARMHEIQKAAGPKCILAWPLGNHDSRFESRLAAVAPEYAGVRGVSLKDHFSDRWQPCWSVWINDDVVVKHRYKNGTHATHNATVNAGMTIVTNHLHSLKVTPFNDYRGIRFGVDTGTLSDPHGPQYVNYSEDNPRNHRSGFAVLTFRKGKLLWPEVVHVISENEVEFRGEVHRV